jgi:hypothetical protein
LQIFLSTSSRIFWNKRQDDDRTISQPVFWTMRGTRVAIAGSIAKKPSKFSRSLVSRIYAKTEIAADREHGGRLDS